MRGALLLRRAALTLCIASVFQFCTIATTHAQSGRRASSAAVGEVEDEIVNVLTEEVLVPVSVRDETGKSVAGLKPERFIIYDNNVRQELTSLNVRRAPANIVLLMDASGSVFSQMKFIREAAKNFARALPPGDKVSVMQFADRVELLQDWTPASETAALEKSLDWRYRPGQRTTFYDALYLAADEQLKKVEGRKLIILLTDGIDSTEVKRADFQDALAAVKRAEASVYVVSLTASLRADIEAKTGGKLKSIFGGYDPRQVKQYIGIIDAAERQLEALATQTGGRIFLPLKEDGLLPAYKAIAEELRSQYIVTYTPRPRAAKGEWRRVRVLITNGNYEIGAREGYFGRT